MKICDTCGREAIKVDGSPGGSDDTQMINDYIMQTNWYKHRKPDWFKISRPNPYSCRRCLKLLVDNGFTDFVGGANVEKFLITQEWWK